MLTDMAPTATAASQFYGSQMGISNIAPHMQKAVSTPKLPDECSPERNLFKAVATYEKHWFA